ncbi:MAG TPA: hypothetical protein VLC53_06245 [Myxococcota bacterium]|nr:hypothetical protein [Myxococcota bacterium]
MRRRSLIAGALAASLAAAPALAADDTLSGTLISVDDDGKSFTIQTSEGKNHTFETPGTIDLREVEPGTDLQVTAESITDVDRDERRKATAVAVLPRDDEESETAPGGDPVPGDPASGGAPGGGPPSGGIPGGGVPSGGSPSGGIPSGGGVGP